MDLSCPSQIIVVLFKESFVCSEFRTCDSMSIVVKRVLEYFSLREVTFFVLLRNWFGRRICLFPVSSLPTSKLSKHWVVLLSDCLLRCSLSLSLSFLFLSSIRYFCISMLSGLIFLCVLFWDFQLFFFYFFVWFFDWCISGGRLYSLSFFLLLFLKFFLLSGG